MSEPTIAVNIELTKTEAAALSLASGFGPPAKRHEPLQSARRKLREAVLAVDSQTEVGS